MNDIKPGDTVTALDYGIEKTYKVLNVGHGIVRVVNVKSGITSFKFTENVHKKGE